MRKFALPIIGVASASVAVLLFLRDPLSPRSFSPGSASFVEPAEPSSSAKDKRPPEVTERNLRNPLDHELLTLASSDLESALAYWKANYDGTEGQRALCRLTAHACKSDLRALPRLLGMFSSGMERDTALWYVAHYWARAGPEQFIRVAQTDFNSSLRANLLAKLSKALIREDRIDLAKHAFEYTPPSAPRADAIGDLVNAIAVKEGTSAALAWVSDLKSAPDIKRAERCLLNRWSFSNNIEALQQLIAATKDNDIAGFASNALGRAVTIQGGFDQIGAIFDSIPEQLRVSYLLGAVANVPEKDLSAVGDYISSIKDSLVRCSLGQEYVGRVFRVDESRAIEWALNSAPDIRSELIQALVRAWHAADSVALSRWIHQLPVGKERDAAVAELALNLAPSDAAAARETASTIGNASLRNKTLNWIRRE